MKKHIIFMLGVILSFIVFCSLFLFRGWHMLKGNNQPLNKEVYALQTSEIQEEVLDEEPASIKDEQDLPEEIIITDDSNKYENRWNITLTDEEIELLARIVMLEAGGESDRGRDAVVEVIFNRMYDEDFPDTLEGVLSQSGQFTVWKNRKSKAANPTEEVYESIHYVLNGQTNVLPYETVYFSRGGEPGKEEQINIDNHVFCNK